MSMTVIPVGKKLLLKKWKVETKTASGIIIPEIGGQLLNLKMI